MMHSLRLRTLILIGLILMTLVGGGLKVAQSNLELMAARQGLSESHALESQAWQWLALKDRSPEDQELEGAATQLRPAHRAEAWKEILASLGQANKLAGKVEIFAKNEKEYRRFTANRLPYLQSRLEFWSLLTIGITGLALISLLLTLRQGMFIPLRRLARKMSDFLEDRYTYQFTLPAPTEVGQLHATFNALAQRVLANMDELKSLDHAKSEFLSIASHELRTPLTSIKGSLSLMRSGVTGDLNEMSQNLLQIAETETDRLIRLINELLDLAKIEAGRFEIHPEWHDLPPSVDKTLAGLQGLAQAAGVELKARDLPPLRVWMDRDCVQQVLTNLISNAIKFSPRGSTVEVTGDLTENHELMLSVKDQGKGIAPEDQALIFQKFRQATNANNPLVKGTGLGLTIAKALVEEHGGEIGLRSTPGQGSTFHFTLPRWEYARPTETMSSQSGAAA